MRLGKTGMIMVISAMKIIATMLTVLVVNALVFLLQIVSNIL